MRFTLSAFVAILLVAGCERHENSRDDRMQNILPGIWVSEAKYANGGAHECKFRVARDATYVSTIVIAGRTNGPRSIHQEGTLRVESGVLIDTITKDSQTNARVPSTNYARIVRINGQELVLDYEKLPGVVHPTNQTVFRKHTN